jgi:hypothetical protein
MATNSTDNPAPIENISIFNPAEWDNTEKSTTSTTINSELATLSGNNIFSGSNDFSFYPSVYYNKFIINNSYQLTGSQVITNASSTITTPLFPIYLVNLTSALTITLPTASSQFENCKIIFRRLNNSNFSRLSNSFVIYNSALTATTTTIIEAPPSVPSLTAILTCMYILSIDTYGWVRILAN